MDQRQPILVLEKNFQETVRWTMDRLGEAGLEVLETFNLKSAVPALSACGCPHHGTDLCDCQMAVLLVYKNGYPPTSLILHGQDGRTWLTIVDSPWQWADLRTVTAIRSALRQRAETADDVLSVDGTSLTA